VYVLAGGDGGKCVLAFDRDKGSLVWSAASEEIEYSSPALATLAGVRQLVVIGKERVFSVAAADGKELWSLDVKTDGWATPVILPDDRVFLPLEDRLMMVRCQGTGGDGEPEVLWTARGHEGYAHSFGYRDKYLYGVSKRRTVCLDADTGETAWSDRSKESAAIVSRDHLVILSRKEGVLRMIQATPDGLRECLSQEAFPEGSHWTPPVAAKGLLYLRSGADLVAYRFLEE
jgi:outer membrane protein assembly factor BamB